MKPYLYVAVPTCLLLLGLSCGPAQHSSESETKMTSHAEDIAAVNQLLEDYGAAWAKGDPELLLACYADDAVVIMSLESAIIGKEALRELYQHVFGGLKEKKTEDGEGEEENGLAAMAETLGLDPADYTFTSDGEQKKMEVSGDLGYTWSTYMNAATPKAGVGGEPIKDGGDSLLIVRRQHDGSWKVALGMSTRSADPLAAVTGREDP